MDQYPGRFYRFISVDVTRPDAAALFTQAVKDGAIGFGELKYQVACDGPEMRKVYELAAELNVPITMHFQEVSQLAAAGKYNYNIERLPAMLKAYPKTTFIGHADYFWANISADAKPDVPYPKGPVKRGGLTDKMLSDYPNLLADLSANSCRNALARDLEFSRDFLARHQDKLMFGSDCSCRDGHGAGQRSPEPLITGKCVARETLTALKQLTTPEVFRKLTWENAHKRLRLA
jgi:predicted TIM-barrel fold metal-dependent hydrolase